MELRAALCDGQLVEEECRLFLHRMDEDICLQAVALCPLVGDGLPDMTSEDRFNRKQRDAEFSLCYTIKTTTYQYNASAVPM